MAPSRKPSLGNDLVRLFSLSLVPLLIGATGAGSTPTSIDKSFVCPETMRSDMERMASLRSFFSDYAAARPDATPSDIIEYRRLLLAKHGCSKTLKHVDESNRAVEAGDVEKQAWLPITSRNGASLAMSTDHNAVVVSSQSPNEKAVDAFARLTLSQTSATDVTKVSYDEVVSHSVYLCKSRRYSLEANTYFLNGRQVLKDEGEVIGRSESGRPIYSVDPIPPGSMNEDAWHWACEVAKGAAM